MISGVNSRDMCIKKILNDVERMKRSLKLKQIRENARMSIAVTAACLFVENDIGNVIKVRAC